MLNMNAILNGPFFSPSKGNLSFLETIKEIVSYIFEQPDKEHEIIVGCDSSSSEEPVFPIVIVVLRKKRGGRFFLKKVRYSDKKFYHWKQRILEETTLSCKFALELKEVLDKEIKDSSNYEFRYIHADIGENGATKEMIKEIVNLIRGNGFEPKIKPNSFAASVVADKYT